MGSRLLSLEQPKGGNPKGTDLFSVSGLQVFRGRGAGFVRRSSARLQG
jgi:hypothetical protein